ncbi:hypothetical protein [Streptomyces shenzhenensis]|uniref:hypothetical protein n=1 Tax=Streptomyces shenzhenensis TaxID=943815 RepID=UPI0015EFFBAE|nr:hypothetical protein [Streptomyces shenzhenensis]
MTLVTVLAVAVGTLDALPAAAVSSVSAAEEQETQPELTDAQRAAQEAVESGERVEVKSERGEYATTYANPDGTTFSLSLSTVPVRARQADGSWTSARRHAGAPGRRHPRPEGERRGCVLLRRRCRRRPRDGGRGRALLTVGWPGALPEPTLDGASAVYPEVLPGVDLRMTATTEGYREVLVVKTPEAAASEELRKLDFPVRTQGLTLSEGAGGGLNAIDDNGNAVFRTPTARQWDSAGDAATAGPSTMSLTAADEQVPSDGDHTPDPAAGPSDGDASAVLPVAADADSSTVVPDTALLTGGKSNVGSACALTFHMSGHDAAVCQSGYAAQVWAMEYKVEGYVTVDVGDGGTTANSVPGASGNKTGNDGAADVILWTKDKVYIWEVKPGNEYGKTDGPKDLTRYVEGMSDYLEDEGDDRTVERGPGLLSGRAASREGIVNVWSKAEYPGMRFYGRKNRDNPTPRPGPSPAPKPTASTAAPVEEPAPGTVDAPALEPAPGPTGVASAGGAAGGFEVSPGAQKAGAGAVVFTGVLFTVGFVFNGLTGGAFA